MKKGKMRKILELNNYAFVMPVTVSIPDTPMPPEILLFLVGGIFTAIAANILIKSKNFEKTGKCTEATVVETIREHMGGDGGGYTYVPVLKYRVDGCTYKVRYHVGNIRPIYKDGEIVKIKYDPKNVENIVIEGDESNYIVASTLCMIGVIMIGVGLYRLIS